MRFDIFQHLTAEESLPIEEALILISPQRQKRLDAPRNTRQQLSSRRTSTYDFFHGNAKAATASRKRPHFLEVTRHLPDNSKIFQPQRDLQNFVVRRFEKNWLVILFAQGPVGLDKHGNVTIQIQAKPGAKQNNVTGIFA